MTRRTASAPRILVRVWATNSSIEARRMGRGRTTAAAPVSHVAWMAVTRALVVGPRRATWSPGVTPRACRAPAIARASSCNLAHSTRSGGPEPTKVMAPAPVPAACSMRVRREVSAWVIRRSTLRSARRLHLRLVAGEEGQFPPLPEALDVLVADLAQPAELGLDVEQLVGGILLRSADQLEELGVQALSRRRHVFEVGEYAAGLDHVEDLFVHLALALVRAVVDGEGRHDQVEGAEVGQWGVEVVLHDLDVVGVEA